jgi:hypothetical protein
MPSLLDHPLLWSELVSRLTGTHVHDVEVILQFCRVAEQCGEHIQPRDVLAKMKTYCHPASAGLQ